MKKSDQEFREEFQPLHVPAYYSIKDTLKNKIIYTLAQSGEGDIASVTAYIKAQEPGIDHDQLIKTTNELLKDLFDKGLINGLEIEGSMVYNLNKITNENKGSVDPHLLAPGLD